MQHLSFPVCYKYIKNKIYRNIILPIVLYGCETWSLILRERHELMVYENKVLWKTFESKRNEVKREWRKLHNGELHDLYTSLNIIRVIKSVRMGGAGDVALRRRGEICVQKPEGKKTLGSRKRRWEYKIEIDLEKWDGGMYWIYLTRDKEKWRAMWLK